MNLSNLLTVVDLHTAGEPFRIVTSGFPTIHGNDMREKNAYVEKNLEDLRRMVFYEPRGRSTMCGAFLIEPTVPELTQECIHGTYRPRPDVRTRIDCNSQILG